MFPCNNDKKPIVTGWQTYTGKCETPLYGIAVPEGFVVIDLDLYKNNNLKSEVAKFLGVELDWENSLIQKTKSGGTHHAFETCEVIKQGSDIRDHNGDEIKGFDIRSAGKGYICSGEGYSENLTDNIFSFLPELPEGLPIVDKVINSSFDDNDLGDFDGLLGGDVDIEHIKELLSKIDNNIGNEEWVRVGMAIHSELPNQEGCSIWDEWSKCGETYKDGECQKRWASFSQGGSITMGTLNHMAGHIAKAESVSEYELEEVVKERIRSEYKRGALGVKFEPDTTTIKLILKNTYYTCSAKTFFKMFNKLGQVIRVNKNEIASIIIDNFGQPIKNYKELSKAVEVDDDLTVTQKKQVLAQPLNVIINIIMEFQQRERITQCVDIFADESHMNIKPKEVIESLKYEPIAIEHELYDEEIIEAYKVHFPELYQVLDMIVASRFASSRKKCYLWIKADSDWGKDLFRVCLAERGMEMSMTQIGKAIKGETVSVHMDDIVGTFAVCVNEFSHINGELKQIEDKIVIAPKYMNQSTIPTYAKLFFSADDVDSLVGEYGVESQYANRFSTLTYTGSIDQLPIFHKVGQYTFTHVLKTHVGNYINESVERYIKKGIEAASIEANKVVSEFHKKHGISSKVGDLDSNIKSLADIVARAISVADDDFKVLHNGEPVYTRARTAIQEVLIKIGGKSESVKLTSKWKKILELIAVDDCVKVYKIDGKPVKGFKLKMEQSCDF